MFERITSWCATAVVFNSPSIRSVAERERIVTAGSGVILGSGSGNGLDVSRFDSLPTKSNARAQLGFDPGATVIAFVGRLTRDKGIADLVSAFAVLSPTRPDALLVLVGSFEDGDPVSPETKSAIAAGPVGTPAYSGRGFVILA